MSRRTVKVAVTAVALAFSGGLGLWTATAAPADEVPPAAVEPSTSSPGPVPTAPATTAPAAPTPSGSIVTTAPERAGGISCGLCAVPNV